MGLKQKKRGVTHTTVPPFLSRNKVGGTSGVTPIWIAQKYGKRRGITFVELIMVIVIVAVISVGGAFLLAGFIQNAVYIPNKLNMDMVVSDALDIMIEGDDSAKGLRFSRAVTNIQPNQITFSNQDFQSIVYRLDAGTNKLYRTINTGPEELIPYYVTTGIDLTGTGSTLFTYFDANEVVTTNPADVRAILVRLIARTGSGSYADWEGQSEQSTAVAVKRF